MAAGGGPIQISPASITAVGEGCVLGQEAVARDGSRRRRCAGRCQDLGDVEVGLGRSRAAQRVRLVGQ